MAQRLRREANLQETIATSLAKLDLEASRASFLDNNEFLFLDRFLPRAWIDGTLAARARELKPLLHRNRVRNFKQGGSISAYQLEEHAPEFVALYQDPTLRAALGKLADVELQLCPETDPHAVALYYYTETGDHIGYHYDTSWYRGARYTVLIGLVQETTHSKLLCQLFKDDPSRQMQQLEVATEPGSLVLFNGDKLWHAVSPLAEGEERIVLSMEYVTDPHMNVAKRWVSNLKDAIAYFGFGGIQRRPRPTHGTPAASHR